jgi:hypothetical protein
MFGSIGAPELVLLGLIAAAVIAIRKRRSGTRGRSALGPLSLRALVFLGGALDALIGYAIATGLAVPPDGMALLRGAVSWAITFELIHVARSGLRPRTLPVYAVFACVSTTLLSIALLLLPVIGIQDGGLRSQLIEAHSAPASWFGWVTAFPYNVLNLASGVALSGLAIVLLNRASVGASHHESRGWSGFKGGDMTPAKSQTTRLLCASAVLLGSAFRKEVLSYLENQSHAVSPELGVDMGIVARVCAFIDQRSRRFDTYLFLAIPIGGFTAIIDPVLGAIAFAATSITVFFQRVYGERVRLIEHFRRDNFDRFDPGRDCPVTLKPEVQSALQQADHNLIVYTGFTPFIGAGTILGGWSFTVDVSKPAEGFMTASSFGVEELYDAIDHTLTKSKLDGLSIDDFFFVGGRDVRTDLRMLPDAFARPVQRLDAEAARGYVVSSDSRVRHYKWIRVHDWGQELVVSFFLRCSLRGSSLFVEINRCLLTPLADRYRGVDSMSRKRKVRTIGAVIESVIVGPFYAAFTPFILFGYVSEAIREEFGRKERDRRRLVDENPDFDFGAGQGLRSAFSSGQFGHYFQKADGDFYGKLLERSILDRIVTFLNEHQVDTSEIKERQTMILNSGIIVQGGDLKAESLAVGAGARAVKSGGTTPKAVKGAAA